MSTQEIIYREILEHTHGKRMMNIADVKAYTGLGDYRTIRNIFPFGKNRVISAHVVAKIMAGEENDG